jgi:tetratricopeptide (TPR) repeat protein
VVSLDARSFDAHLNLGIALADAGRSEEALAEFSEAVKLAPNQAAPHYNKGRVLGQLHRYGEALPELERASTLDPASPDAWYRLGIARRELKQYDEAVNALRQALQLTPGNADASYLLGQSYQSLGKMDEAIAAWRGAMESDPNNQQALYSLMRALGKRDPAASARYQARLEGLKATRSQTEQAETLSNFAIAAAKESKWDDAIAQLRQAIQICGGCSSLPQLHKNLGLIQCQAGRFDDCGAELRIALEKMPGDAEILKALEILRNMGARVPHAAAPPAR